MSSSALIRQKIAALVKTRGDHEKKAADARERQARKAAEATNYRLRASKASSQSTARLYLSNAEFADRAAGAEARRAADESRKAADCTSKEAALNKELAAAIAVESAVEKRTRDRQEAETKRHHERQMVSARQQHQRELRTERERTTALLAATEKRLTSEMNRIRPPKTEQLRILYLTATAKGDLRVDEEIRRVKAGVRAATHRDLVHIEHMPAATAGDLLDGLTRVRPHVVHFSGHANESVLEFDTGSHQQGPGHAVSAEIFARAISALDTPPTLIVLNACRSEAQLAGLLGTVPLAIGMSETIGDIDALTFAARFYTALADGQSVESAFNVAKVQMELSGLAGADLPVLVRDTGIDSREVVLVIPAE